MKHKPRWVLIGLGLLAGLSSMVGIIWFWLWDLGPGISAKQCKALIPATNETLYFRTAAWGVAGSHWQVVLSANPSSRKGTEYEKDTEYFFNEPDGLLFKVNQKTLEVHAHWFKGPKPERFESKTNVRIITHDYNPDWQELLREYKQRGLTDVNECANDQISKVAPNKTLNLTRGAGAPLAG